MQCPASQVPERFGMPLMLRFRVCRPNKKQVVRNWKKRARAKRELARHIYSTILLYYTPPPPRLFPGWAGPGGCFCIIFPLFSDLRHHCGFQVRPGGPRRPRRPQDGPKTAPRRPKTPTRRAEDVFFCARVPENLIKPVVFYTFLQCVATPPRRTGDASRQLQDAFRTPPKKKSAVLGASWARLGASSGVLGRLGTVLGAF